MTGAMIEIATTQHGARGARGMRRSLAHARALAMAGAAAAGALLAAAGAAPVAAQGIVQAMPPREAAQLNAALRELARRPSDLEALISAGNASLALHDGGAAAGFFARAARVAPADRRVLVGQARVALEQRRPVDALRGFADAERAGVRPLDIAADRALAYDLVGDNAAAQALYRSVLAAGDSAEVRRRLALSLAITGDRTEFERTLYPLLRDEDRSAFRTRAFGLAILGRPDDAVAIADAMMSTDLALRMAPYLRYMPRLTKAQQAAAGNLGAFPAAAEIGRDTPDIANYAAAGARIAARADTSLTPSGAALGPRVSPPTSASPPPASAARLAVATPTNTAARRPLRETGPVPARPAPARTAQVTPAAAPSPAPASRPAAPPAERPVALAQNAPVPVLPAPAPAPAPAQARPSLADAFADLGTVPAASAAASEGAVDLATLETARKSAEARAAKARADKVKADAAKLDKAKLEKAKLDKADADKAKAEKAAKAAEPARNWIQVGVGRNVAAFSFDWKKLAKEAGGALDGKGPWAVKYGASNRMLAGPYATDAAAKAALKRLKDKGIDALPYDSAEGEKVTKAN